jgi:glycosyltransferase involved in cell wall biosynthesis
MLNAHDRWISAGFKVRRLADKSNGVAKNRSAGNCGNMGSHTTNTSLQIGYLMQNGAPNLNDVSGPQLHVEAIIRGLQKKGHHVRTVAIQQSKLLWGDDLHTWSIPQFSLTQAKWFRLIESGLRRMQFELRLPFFGLFDSLRYADACTQVLMNFDILYERHGYMGFGGVTTARRLGIPLILELNGNIIKEIDEMGIEMSPTQRNLGRWITARTFLAANKVVAVSEALKQHLVADLGIPSEKIVVVTNGVDVELFSQEFDQGRIRRQYGLGSGPIIAFVGSFKPWHGVDLLVSGYKLVQSRFPDSQLVLVGDGVGRDNLAKTIADNGLKERITLSGQLARDQVAAILSIADVVAAPYPYTHTEIVGTPLKLLEYMAAGKAIVASTAPIHDIIINGRTGLRVKPASADSLAQGICHLLDDEVLRSRLAANAARQAQSHSWEHVVEKLLGIFEAELLVKKEPGES